MDEIINQWKIANIPSQYAAHEARKLKRFYEQHITLRKAKSRRTVRQQQLENGISKLTVIAIRHCARQLRESDQHSTRFGFSARSAWSSEDVDGLRRESVHGARG